MSHSEQNPIPPKTPQGGLGLVQIRAALAGTSTVPKPPPPKWISSSSVSGQIDSSRVGNCTKGFSRL
eukprot:1135355-Amphidinium_carterae.1